MPDPSQNPDLSHAALKQRQRAIRDGFGPALALRVHRALSWLGRAEAMSDDPDVRFMLLWVAFNAAYASDIEGHDLSEREAFRGFFEVMHHLDGSQRLYSVVWSRYSKEVRLLLDNRYIFDPFWRYQNGDAACADHVERLVRAKSAINRALAARDTPTVLSILFDRLYVLRNQLVHGGATWASRVNRDQVLQGCALLGALVPLFVDIMMDHPGRDWGRPYYPVVD